MNTREQKECYPDCTSLKLGQIDMGHQAARSNYPFTFDKETAVEGVLYIAQKVSEPSFHKVLKILYFADRKHLERYGRLISGDCYVAMRHGPVASSTYDLLKTARNGITLNGFAVAENGFYNKPIIVPLRQPDMLELSESDLECLNESIAEHGHKSKEELTRDSHDATWHATEEDDIISLEDLLLGIEGADALRKYIYQEGL